MNTSNMLQVRRPQKGSSLIMCVMCGVSSTSIPHLFLPDPIAVSLLNTLFDIFGGCVYIYIDQFLLTCFTGFGRRK